MKFIYASLGALSAVSAFEDVLFQAAEEIVGQFVKEIDNGFELHFGNFLNGKYFLSEDLVTGGVQFNAEQDISFSGEVENVIRKEITASFGEKTLLQAHLRGSYDDVPDFLKDFYFGELSYGYDTFEFHETISFQAVPFPYLHWNYLLINENSSGEEARFDADLNINVDFDISEHSSEFILSHVFEEEHEGFPEWTSFPDESTSALNIAIDDLAICEQYLNHNWEKGVKCDIKWNYNGAFGTQSDQPVIVKPSGKLSFKQAAVTFDFNLGVDEASDEENYHTLFLRSEEYNEKKDNFKVGNDVFDPYFYSFYYINGAKDDKLRRKQMKKRSKGKESSAFLLFRLPGEKTFNDVLVPILEEKFAVYDEFIQRLTYETDSLPHLIYYFDKLSDNMSDEFNFAKFIELSRINTDADLLSIFESHDYPTYDFYGNSQIDESQPEEDFNQQLQSIANDVNDFIINDIFGCEYIEGGLNEVRSFVDFLTSEEGQNHYNKTWGTVFDAPEEEPELIPDWYQGGNFTESEIIPDPEIDYSEPISY